MPRGIYQRTVRPETTAQALSQRATLLCDKLDQLLCDLDLAVEAGQIDKRTSDGIIARFAKLLENT